VKARILKVVLLGAVVAAGTISLSSGVMAGQERMYKVTITNAMRGQPVAPSVIATHTAGFHLFHLGPAPEEGDPGYDYYWGLAVMAETGFPFYVRDNVSASPAVWEAKALPYPGREPPVLLPSESISTMISASGNAKYLSSVAMIGATNDAVYAVMGVNLPRGVGETVHATAHAYDIGSEANDESPSTVGALGATDDDPELGTGINENGEGFIHVHAGIHGVGGAGGLDPAMFDWRDPVVLVTVERIE
jgi:hypothetical protein